MEGVDLRVGCGRWIGLKSALEGGVESGVKALEWNVVEWQVD